ncbi:MULTISPECIES: hypothetical protein [Aphanizomenonaceae]|jgi:hypothetical protein|uniref:Bacteriocin n=1 Tax=Dolichospermum heterosporum TAC447 TaxID=747523 RepID=A0ABY5LU90_9CYAN|nr:MULTISPECIES: hypothetical protein [Aphanizomenonaceae]MBE9259109.1 hypothetical protein [Dolichospermum sp. LEGE 00246]MDK2409647.1 hypothetical protein [Aphanizomenon sp. 202]MDK2460498.1 hypothetical protein [Aphanizomenon sp. PH219]UUO13169.1 hypothetical protein NG743_13735 [Dolichospermum heterosporum TAC447]
MSNQNIPSQNIPFDLVVELSVEEQQLLSGGHGGWHGGWHGGRRGGRHGGWRGHRRHGWW